VRISVKQGNIPADAEPKATIECGTDSSAPQIEDAQVRQAVLGKKTEPRGVVLDGMRADDR